MILALIGIVLAAVAALVLIGVVMAVLGTLFGLVFGGLALLFKLLPVLLAGWVIVKLIQRAERPRGALCRSDAQWLDTRG